MGTTTYIGSTMSLGGLETGVESASEPSLTIDERDVKEIIESIKEAQYFDASSMAPLTPASVAAIVRLRAYTPPPFATWDKLPLSRKAAVLILLFADRRGDLRVVLTMRASTLRNYSGQAAFHGGKQTHLTRSLLISLEGKLARRSV